ncbi:MAG: AMP-binding protein [Pseudonocardiaceae bacterium]
MVTPAQDVRAQWSARSFVEAFSANVRRFPDSPALLWWGAPVSYRELHDRALRARAELSGADLGVAPIGLRCSKSPDSIALILACLMDQRSFLLPATTLPEPTLEELFRRAGCARVLTVSGSSGRYSWVATPRADGTRRGRGAAGCVRSFSPDPEAVTFMLTTSGSTGLPKIVPLREGAVDRFTDWAGEQFELGAGRVVLNFSPLNFDLCLLDIWATLKHGGCVVLVDPARATNGHYLRGLLTSHAVGLVQAVPMFYQLLIQAQAHRDNPDEFASVRHVVVTGDSITPQCLAQLPGLFPRARLYNLYGCTETNDSLLHEIDPTNLPTGALPLGIPLPGVRALLVNEDGTVREGPGTGELYVSTPFQTSGYLNHPRHESRFVAHPYGTDTLRYFRTGDLVHRHENGSLTLEGRTDFQVKIRGVRLNIEEVERVLRSHPDIAEVAVVAVPDLVAGHLLHAETRRVPGSMLNTLSLRSFCADRLHRIAIPSTFQITEDPLPRTSTGKPDRHLMIAHLSRRES